MKKVVLIGDSIRMGYQETVGRSLEGIACVWGPEQNGGTSQRVLTNLDDWAICRDADVVHVNCGLHDLRKEFGGADAAVPLDAYEANVRGILERLTRETKAQTIWALTTPVNEAWHHERKGFDRLEADVIAYNRVATSLAAELDVPINDLFAVVTNSGRDGILSPDGVHFTEAGSDIIGKAVACCIHGLLTGA